MLAKTVGCGYNATAKHSDYLRSVVNHAWSLLVGLGEKNKVVLAFS